MIALPTIRPCELARRARAAALVLLPVSLLGCGSVEPPAVKGMMMVTGLAGQAAPCAAERPAPRNWRRTPRRPMRSCEARRRI